MTVRSTLGVALIWVAAVTGASVTAWVAIDRAGRDITGGVVDALPLVTLGSAIGTSTSGSGPSGAAATPDPSAVPEPSGTREPSATTQPSASQQTPAPARPSTASRDRTFSVDGGQVSVRCTGSTIRLRIAQPADGWRVGVENAGPEEVQVNFRRGDGGDGGESQVTAVCASGAPALKVEDRG